MHVEQRKEDIYVGRPGKPAWWMVWERKARRLDEWWKDVFGDVDYVTWDEFVLQWQLHCREWKECV